MPDQNLDALERRVAALEGQVGRLGATTDTVTAMRQDLATIVEAIDLNLRARVADPGDRVERHGLLLARLLDKTGDDT